MTKYNSATSNPTEQTQRRRDLRNNATPAEAALWRWLKSGGAGGWKFRRQHGMGPYIMDFYCPALRLCVELDGSAHDYSFERDEERTRFLQSQGITVMRFRNEVVWSCPQGIVEEIVRFGKAKLQTPPPAPAVATTPNPSSPEEGNRRGAATAPRPAVPEPAATAPEHRAAAPLLRGGGAGVEATTTPTSNRNQQMFNK